MRTAGTPSRAEESLRFFDRAGKLVLTVRRDLCSTDDGQASLFGLRQIQRPLRELC